MNFMVPHAPILSKFADTYSMRNIREHELRLYGHVARLPTEDPAYQMLSRRDPRG